MAGGLLLGSLIHAIDLADTNPIMVYGVNGLFDIGGKAFVASLKLLVVPSSICVSCLRCQQFV